jgi:hypothetical protein
MDTISGVLMQNKATVLPCVVDIGGCGCMHGLYKPDMMLML